MKQKLSGKLALVLFTFLALTAHKSHKVLRVQTALGTPVVPCLLTLTPCMSGHDEFASPWFAVLLQFLETLFPIVLGPM